mgnify:CR=1 FL=1
MEFIDGQSISQQLEFTGPFAPLKAAEFVEQAAHGLAAAHANGLIHRDVKSSNILIEHQTQAAKVIDFGLVREDTQETRLTIDGMLAGTPAYISPEQIVDPSAVDAGTDVYSLGIVLYEMLTGTVPFRGVVRMTLQQVQHVEPQPLRELNDDIPRDLQTICLRAIEKDPERRYPTAAAFADDLRRFIDNRPIVARPVSRLEKSWRWCQRNPRISVLSALVAFAMMSTFGVTAAAAYRLSLAAQEVKEADTSARLNADALMVQRDAAMETVRKLVFDITPLLLELPADTSGVEEAILMTALEGLDRVADSAEDSGEIDYNTAYALQQLGYALYAAEDYENAKSQLNRCLNLVQKMKAGDETVTLTAAMEHEVHLMLADVLQAEGDPANELIQLETSLRIAEDWANIVPVDPDALLAKSVTLRLIGAWMNEGGKASESDRYMQSSREVVTDVLKEWPDHEIALIELEELDAWQPEQIEGPFTPEVKRKKRNLQSELRTMERHLIENGDSPVSRASVVNALSKLARWHTVFGDSDQAEVLYDRVRDLISEDADVDAVQLLRIDRLAAEEDSFRNFVFAAYSRRLIDLLRVVDDVAFGRIDVRLAERLLDLGEGLKEVRATHQDLASELGTAREVISRVLNDFQKRDLIGQSRGLITFKDKSSLSAIARSS